MGVKLSEIFERYEKIKSLDSHLPKEKLLTYIVDFNQQLENLKFIEFQELKSLEKELLSKLDAYLELNLKIQNKLKNTVDSNQKEYLETNKKIWHTNLEKMTFSEHLVWEKMWPPSEIEFKHFSNQIKQHVNWQYPGLIFGAKNTDMIKSLIGLEPMYVVERFSEYFNLQKEKFHQDFARKIRFYDFNNMDTLPQNAIGIIVVYNEFNFLPWNYITYALDPLAKSLKPGGILIFTFNNCDTARGFKEFENWNMTYTNSKMFEKFLSRYDIYAIENYTSPRETFSFMTFKKNGNNPLIKKSPNVGFVKQQPTFNTPKHQIRLESIRKLIDTK